MEHEDAEPTLKMLVRLTNFKICGISMCYQYRLMLKFITSIYYTHGFIKSMSLSDQETFNWIFCGLAILSCMWTLASGLIFLAFAYATHTAHLKKSLFESGIMVEEEPLSRDKKSVFDNLNIYREGFSSVEKKPVASVIYIS
jgi:hypothetical protein